MTDWTPSTPYAAGDIVTGPALVSADYTIPERLAMSATALVACATAAFVIAKVWPLRRLLSRSESLSAVGLLLAAALLSLGVALIADWRRKRRPQTLPRGWKVETYAAGALSTEFFDDIDPLDELEHHLTEALAVLLREPSLKIDAGTLRMLTKYKERRPVVRDEKGRWRSVQ